MLRARRAMDQFKHDIPEAQVEFMRMDLADFGCAADGRLMRSSGSVVLI